MAALAAVAGSMVSAVAVAQSNAAAQQVWFSTQVPSGFVDGNNGTQNMEAPVINTSGAVAFVGSYNASPTRYILTGQRGSVSLLYRDDQVLPGASGTITDIAGLALRINSSGLVAFNHTWGAAATPTYGVWAGTPGSLGLVMRSGVVYATPIGLRQLSGPLTTVLDDTGSVAVFSFFTAGQAGAGNAEGLFYGPVSPQGAPVMFAGLGLSPAGFVASTDYLNKQLPMLSPGGKVIFHTVLSPAQAPGGQHLLGGMPSSFTALYSSGTSAAGIPATATSILPAATGTTQYPVINDAGQIGVMLTASTASTSSQHTYVGLPGSLNPIISTFDPLPGRDATDIPLSVVVAPLITSSGAAAVMVNMTGSNPGGDQRAIVFRPSDGGPVQTVVRSGDAAPGFPAGAQFREITQVAVARDGFHDRVVFRARVRPYTRPGVAQAGHSLWKYRAGALSCIVTTGDALLCGDGALRTVDTIAFNSARENGHGGNGGLAYNGWTSYVATFTDGTSGVFAIPPLGAECVPDVAGPNQSIGPDGVLGADDIIVFLGWYFANDTRADIAGANQSVVPDGLFTADDIIVFLSRFFAGC